MTWPPTGNRFYLLGKLSSLSVRQQLLELVYKTTVESVVTFHLPACYGHLNCRSKNKLSRIVSMASKIVGKSQKPLTQLYTERTRKKAKSILADSSHRLFSQFESLCSRKCYRTPLATKNIFEKSFIPGAIHILNAIKWWTMDLSHRHYLKNRTVLL